MCKFYVEVVLVRSTKKKSAIMHVASYFLVLEFTDTNAFRKAFDSSRLGQ